MSRLSQLEEAVERLTQELEAKTSGKGGGGGDGDGLL